MNKGSDHLYRQRMAVMLLMLCGMLLTATAQKTHRYTEEHPLVIVSDWEFPPYEFSNDNGEPDGYNIEVLNIILDRLKIPHRYVMQEWYMATETFEHRQADLIFALSFNYMKKPYVMTRNLLHFYRIVSVRRPEEKPLTKISQLGKKDTVIMKANDYAPIRILMMNPDPSFIIEYHSPKEALAGVSRGKFDYFLWGEIPIQRKIKEFSLNDLVTDLTDIPPGELRLIGYDKDLIDAIDDEYARLEQAGQLEPIFDKWFHPEREHNNTSTLPIFIIVGAIIVSLISFLLSRLIRIRVQKAIYKSREINNMMTQALSMGNYYVIEHDLTTHRAHNVYGNLLPPEGLTSDEFIERIAPEQRQEFWETMQEIIRGELKSAELKNKWNAGTPEKPVWRYLHGNSILEMERGKPRYIVNSVKDVTREIMDERHTRETSERYIKIFKTCLFPMSFYDGDQHFIDANDQMLKLSGIDVLGDKMYREMRLEDMPILTGDFLPESHENFYVCQHLVIPQAGIDSYIEFRIYPVVDEGSIIYYIVTARDVTNERLLYLEQRKHDTEMRRISDAANTYEDQLQYLLEKSRMYVWRFSLEDRIIHLSQSLRKVGSSYNYADYLEGLDPKDRDSAEDNMLQIIMKGKEFKNVRYFEKTPINQEPSWYALSGIPFYNNTGELTGYFGVARDITELVSIQQKLKEETSRAEDSGKLKSVFLANMTHEIRTPLNAIVGFSDLLPMVDTKEERMEFIRIIRNNCDMLLRLINDILEASSMGQALAIKPVACDFAQVFDDICQTLAQRVDESGVEFIKDNPYDTFPATLDKGRIQQVLTNFTTNAVKYTHQGYIKVGYREQDGGIYFYCEDTGAGIPKEKQASVFERFVKLNDFVQGTGLGLSICKAIAERCGGKIGVTSEGEGHGSTFWLWTPRNITPPQ